MREDFFHRLAISRQKIDDFSKKIGGDFFGDFLGKPRRDEKITIYRKSADLSPMLVTLVYTQGSVTELEQTFVTAYDDDSLCIDKWWLSKLRRLAVEPIWVVAKIGKGL